MRHPSGIARYLGVMEKKYNELLLRFANTPANMIPADMIITGASCHYRNSSPEGFGFVFDFEELGDGFVKKLLENLYGCIDVYGKNDKDGIEKICAMIRKDLHNYEDLRADLGYELGTIAMFVKVWFLENTRSLKSDEYNGINFIVKLCK